MVAADTSLQLALFSAAVLGFRHGFDYDHLAAITDMAAAEGQPRRAMRLGLYYALGHAMTISLLGALVLLFQLSLPSGVDQIAGQAVGLTLIVLGLYVVGTLIFSDTPRSKTRLTLLLNGLLWLYWRLQMLFTSKPVKRREIFAEGYGSRSAFVIGVVHGVGAETPTQLLIFLLAANLGGVANGLLGLGMFVTGMLVMNTIICAWAAGLIKLSSRRAQVNRWVTGLTAAYSVGLGAFFLFGPFLHNPFVS